MNLRRPVLDRVLSEAHSPSAQLNMVEATYESWYPQLVGRIRLDLVGFHNLVLPDSHLLDGPSLLQSDPADLLQRVARVDGSTESPVRVLTREPTLEGSLRQLLRRRDDPGRLSGFVFKVLGRESGIALSQAIANRPWTNLEGQLSSADDGAIGLASFLRDTSQGEGLDLDAQLEMLERGWSKWLTAERDGLLSVEQWSGSFDIKSAAIRTYHDPADFGSAYEHLEAVYRMLERRQGYSSDVDAYLANLSSNASPTELVYLQRIRDWEHDVRQLALAARHRCALSGPVSGSHRESVWSKYVQQDPSKAPPAELPEDFLFRLGSLNPETYRSAISEGRPEGWWTGANPASLTVTLAILTNAVESASVGVRPPSDREQWSEYILDVAPTTMGAVAGLMAGGVPGAIVGGIVAGSSRRLLAGYSSKQRKQQDTTRVLVRHFSN